MDFLTSEELRYLIDEEDLIEDPHPDQAEEKLIESIKYPLSFSGDVIEWVWTDNGSDTPQGKTRDREPNVHTNLDEIEIPPSEYRVLRTRERVQTGQIAKRMPVHIIGFVYLPNTFIRAGLSPCFQGLIDAGWSGGELRITLHNNNPDTSIVISKGDRIAYTFFTYIQTSSPLDSPETVPRISSPDVDFSKRPIGEIGKLEKKLDEMSENFETLREKHEDLNRKVQNELRK